MTQLVNVQCSECGELDQDYWGDFGAENSCSVCDASPVSLFRVDKENN